MNTVQFLTEKARRFADGLALELSVLREGNNHGPDFRVDTFLLCGHVARAQEAATELVNLSTTEHHTCDEFCGFSGQVGITPCQSANGWFWGRQCPGCKQPVSRLSGYALNRLDLVQRLKPERTHN